MARPAKKRARPEPEAPRLVKPSVLLSLEIRFPQRRRQVDRSLATVDADERMWSLSKTLLDCAEVRAISALDGAARAWVRARSLPSHLKHGVYRVPLDLFDEVDAYLVKYVEVERPERVEALLRPGEDGRSPYDAYQDADRLRLRALFSPSDYPEADELRRYFEVSYQWLGGFDAPAELQELRGEVFRRERAKVQAVLAAAAEQARALLRAEMKGLVEHMLERLTPGDDGKPRVFRDTLVPNFNEAVRLLEARDVTDDAELRRLVRQSKALVAGLGSEQLRDFEATRQAVTRGFAEVKAALDPLVRQGGRYVEV